MKVYRKISFYVQVFIACLSFYGCNPLEELSGSQADSPYMPWASPEISGSCVLDMSDAPLATKAMIDQSSTQGITANFLRIDETVDENTNAGTYDFGSTDDFEINWAKADVLEASVTASPDKDYLRSVYFDPVQTYKINVTGNPDQYDTTFYHTRMVGWYPSNCELPVSSTTGNKVSVQFGDPLFSSVLCRDDIPDNGVNGGYAVKFTGLDGKTDLMFSDVREGSHWHQENSFPEGDLADDSRYAPPFGHFVEGHDYRYKNAFTFKHYLTAVRVWVYASGSQQNISMWGDIIGVSFPNQPTSCKIPIPDVVSASGNTLFTEPYGWDDLRNLDIITEPMYGSDAGNDGDYNLSVEFPVSLENTSESSKAYVGYAMLRPDAPVQIGIHTTSGVYYVSVDNMYSTTPDSDPVEIFKAGYIYDIYLNLKTNGTIAALLENEHDLSFFDLSKFQPYDENENNSIGTYKYANCYVVDPDNDVFKDDNGEFYDGFCFSATVIGNGDAGILPASGAQAMHVSSARISPVKARLIWESEKGLISQIELLYGYVRFRVPDRTKHGNAVIGVYDESGNVLWSWHIWMPDSALEEMAETIPTSEGSITVLDRNLGAIYSFPETGGALNTYGLYYQWGRKDPSMGPKSADYRITSLETAPYYDFSMDEKNAAEVKMFDRPDILDGVENPMYLILPTDRNSYYEFNWMYDDITFLWGKQDNINQGQTDVNSINKTIYDPCPFGYRVSDSELETLFDQATGRTSGQYGLTLTCNGTDLFFPYAGYKGVDRGLNSVVSSWKYVGRKGDYQTAKYSDNSSSYHHRERIYISDENTWTENNQKYGLIYDLKGKHYYADHTNRRTAASVRCIKDEEIGSITATIYPSTRLLIPGREFTLNWNVSSSGSPLTSIKIDAVYMRKDGSMETRNVPLDLEEPLGLTNQGSKLYVVTLDGLAELADGSVRFVITAVNAYGLSDTGECRVAVAGIGINRTAWENQIGGKKYFAGQEVTLTFSLNGNVAAPVFEINEDKPVSYGISGNEQMGYIYTITYRCTLAVGDNSFCISAYYDEDQLISGEASERTLHLTAESIEEDSPATSLNAGTKYVIKTSDGVITSSGAYEPGQISAEPDRILTFDDVFSISQSGDSYALGNGGELWVNEDGVWTDEEIDFWPRNDYGDRRYWSLLQQGNGGFKLYYTKTSWGRTTYHYLYINGNTLMVGENNESSATVFYFYPLKPEAQAAM